MYVTLGDEFDSHLGFVLLFYYNISVCGGGGGLYDSDPPVTSNDLE